MRMIVLSALLVLGAGIAATAAAPGAVGGKDFSPIVRVQYGDDGGGYHRHHYCHRVRVCHYDYNGYRVCHYERRCNYD